MIIIEIAPTSVMDTARRAGGSRGSAGAGSSSGSSSSGGSSSSSGGSSGSSSSGGSSGGSGSSGGGSSGGGSSSGGSSSSSGRSSGGRSPGKSTASMVSKLSIAKPSVPQGPKVGTSLPSGGATSGRGADRYSGGPTGTGGIQTVIINPLSPQFGLQSTADVGAKKTNTPDVQNERTTNSDNDDTLKADDQVLDDPVMPEPEIVVDIYEEIPEEEMPEETIPLDEPPVEIVDDPILDSETKIGDEPPVDFGVDTPTNGASEIIDGHTDPILTIPKLNLDSAKAFYQNNKEHLAIAIGITGLVLASTKLKRRG
mgnify:CR=1 FL=1